MYIVRGGGRNANSAQGPITPWAGPGAVHVPTVALAAPEMAT